MDANTCDPQRLRRIENSRWSTPLHIKYTGSESEFSNSLDLNASTASTPEAIHEFAHKDESSPERTEKCRASGPFNQQPSRMRSIVFPVLGVVMPVTLLSVALLALVFRYRVRIQPGPLSLPGQITQSRDNILVNYPATRLTFLASWLSTLAPLLSAAVMGIWCLFVARILSQASRSSEIAKLPDAADMSLLAGLLFASFISMLKYYCQYLWAFLRRGFSPTPSSDVPLVVHRTVTILTLCGLLVLTIFASETYLDVFTQTIEVERPFLIDQVSSAYGRGLSAYCLDFDRSLNWGFPCSYPLFVPNTTVIDEVWGADNEIYRLLHNISTTSEIQFAPNPVRTNMDLAILLPQTLSIPGNIDFRASTIGVATECHPITSTCDMRAPAANPFYTEFNCSDEFWGVVGKAPNLTELSTNDAKAINADLPGMNLKPSAYLQYGFYMDEALRIPYDAAIYNNQTGQLSADVNPLPDPELINPVYMAFAGRIVQTSDSVGSNLTNDKGFFHTNKTYVDFALACSYMTWDVTYSWINGTIANVSSTPTTNGSVAEIFHGRQVMWDTGSDTDLLLQDELLTAALQNTSSAMARTWANLQSNMILSTIGGFATPRTDIQEQIRQPLLVAQIPTIALAALIAASLSYAVLALILGLVALRLASTQPNLPHIAAWLGLKGLAALAFDAEVPVNIFDFVNSIPGETGMHETGLRVGVSPESRDGSPFILVRG